MTPVLGIAGWKNSGKTTLAVKLIGELTRRGYRVASIKHAHHEADIDHENTDTYRHRAAGAAEVALVKELAAAMTRELLNHGAFFSRPYGPAAREIVNRDAASVRALGKIKQTLDPNAVLNPGKLGF